MKDIQREIESLEEALRFAKDSQQTEEVKELEGRLAQMKVYAKAMEKLDG